MSKELIGRYFQIGPSLGYTKEVYGFEVGEYMKLERSDDNGLCYWEKYWGDKSRIGIDLILMPENFNPKIINNYQIY